MAQTDLSRTSRQRLAIVSDAVSVFLLQHHGSEVKVLLMRRATTMKGTWCQVAGGIEAGEKAWQAALREVREETGIILGSLWSGDIVEQFYEPHRDRIAMLPVFVGFVAPQIEVQLNDEHDAYEWLDFDAACARVTFPGQRHTLRTIEAEFVARDPDPVLRIDIA